MCKPEWQTPLREGCRGLSGRKGSRVQGLGVNRVSGRLGRGEGRGGSGCGEVKGGGGVSVVTGGQEEEWRHLLRLKCYSCTAGMLFQIKETVTKNKAVCTTKLCGTAGYTLL